MSFSVARFNAWISACRFNNATEMKDAKQEIIQYFTAEYEKMLKENLEDYIANFEDYMK